MLRRQPERLAVPAGARNRLRTGMRIDVAVERTFDPPVVRQSKRDPLRIVELLLFGPRRFTAHVFPAFVEADAVACSGKLPAADEACRSDQNTFSHDDLPRGVTALIVIGRASCRE